MITGDQLLAHAIGDYVIQSHWMANEKVKRWLAAAIHAVTYGLPFLFLRPSFLAMLVIVGTHAVIDRYRLARWVVGFRNAVFRPGGAGWGRDLGTPFPPGTPESLAIWLVIIADNTAHVLLNGLALQYLP